MTQWTRTISRMVTNASVSLPAWRTAMASANTVYEVGDAPTVLSSKIVWPSAGASNFLFNGGGDGNAIYLHDSYGGSVFVPDLGAYGTMVFGRTGEATVDNQLTKFTLSDDAPTWDFLQQPEYPVSSAEAVTMDADAYYSEADYAALDSGHQIVDEATFTAGWDDVYPVGYKNFVIRRKFTTSFSGNNRPHWFRYGMPCTIPAAMTGTGSSAIIVNSRGTIYGPFGQGPSPSGMTSTRWFADVWGSGNRKCYLWAQNTSTGVWERLSTAIPDFTGYAGDLASPFSCVDEANKRVYYSTYNGSNAALYYADFSSGLSGLTFTGPTTLTDLASGPAPSQSGSTVLCVPTSGANAGRRLWYMKESNATPSLLLFDIDNNTLRRLTITGLPSNSVWWGLTYDAASNTVFISSKNATGVNLYQFSIPTDPTDAANYSIGSPTSLAFDSGVTLESGHESTYQYGERNRYISSLGVILMTQHSGKMLAFRPA